MPRYEEFLAGNAFPVGNPQKDDVFNYYYIISQILRTP